MGSRNLWTLELITTLLKECTIDLPREHRRMITLIANAASFRLALQIATEMHIGRQRKFLPHLSRKKKR